MVVDHSGLTFHVFNSVTVDVVDLHNVVGDIGVVLVLIVDDSLGVQVVSVDGGDDVLVQCCVVVSLSEDCLHVSMIGLDDSLLCWQLHNLAGIYAWSHSWWSIAT